MAVGIDLWRYGDPCCAGGHDYAIIGIQPALHIVAHTPVPHKLSHVQRKCEHTKHSRLHAAHPERPLPGDILCSHLETQLRSRCLPIGILCLLVIGSGDRRQRRGQLRHCQQSSATHCRWRLLSGSRRTLVAHKPCSLLNYGNSCAHRTSPRRYVCPRG